VSVARQPESSSKFSPEDSLNLFNGLRLLRHPQADVENEKGQTKELLELIDGLALGIKQMASYISSKKMKISKFQEQYNKMAKYILEHKTPSTFTHSVHFGAYNLRVFGAAMHQNYWDFSLCADLKISLVNCSSLMSRFRTAKLDGQNSVGMILSEYTSNSIINPTRAVIDNFGRVEQAIDGLRDKALIDTERKVC
jgi:hypothetical protein